MRLIARLTALAAALLLVVSCLDDPTGVSERAGELSLQPRFADASGAAIVDISKVRVVLRGPGETRARTDTVVMFPNVGDTLRLGVLVPLQAATELLELTLAMTNAAGDTVYRAGPIMVTASTDPSRQAPAEPLFTYVGIGANASGVRFVQPPVSIGFSQSVTLQAEAFDAQEAAIAGTPVGFELVNPADSVFAKFVPAGSATLVAGLDSASVTVRALLPGGQTTTHTIEIIAPAPNVWVSALGGDWSDGANWSRGTAPLMGDSVLVTLDGTYSVNVDLPVTLSRLVMGGTTGAQTLRLAAAGSLTVGDSALFGSTVNVDIAGGELGGSGYMRVQQLELSSGSLAHGGTVEIFGNMQWLGGGISPSGTGGLTRILPGAVLVIDGAAVKTFVGPHVIEVAYDPPTQSGGQIIFDGTGDLYAGSGARIVNNSRVMMQGSGDMLSNLDPPMAVFENTVNGTLEATTGTVTGSRSMGFALDNLGSIFLNIPGTDTLRLTGGSVNNFGGFMGAEVGTLALDARTYTLTDALNVAAPLAITGSALLDLGADTAIVGGDLTLRGGGRIRSVSDLALLRVDGNATFDGGASELTAGTLEIGGNFVQSRVSTSFQATGTHVTRFVGLGPQSIAFSSPSPATSQFRTLEIANMSPTDSVVLMSNAYVTDSLHVLTGRLGGVSPHRLVVGGDVNLDNPAGSNFVRPFVLEIGGLFTNDVGGITPDTLVLNRAATYTWDGINVPNQSHLRFNAGIVTFQATSSPGDLIASGSARIVIPATGNRAVLGNLATQGGGTLQMTVGSDLSVNGDATFAGGGTVSLLSGGRLSVAGDFTQSSVNNNASFAPTVTHSTVLTGAGPQSISFDSPAQSQFFRLEVRAPANRTVTLQSDVTVADSLTMLGGAGVTTLVGAGNTQRLVVGGFLRMTQQTGSPRLAPPVLQLSRRPVLDSIFAVASGIHADTVVYVGSSLTTLPTGRPIHYRGLRISTTNTLSMNSVSSFADSIRGDLRITSGGLGVDNATFGVIVGGDLETSGTGTFRMQSFSNVTVNGDARFLGGSTAGLLTNGVLKVLGNFEQGGPNGDSFQASGGHSVEFGGNVIQDVRLATPGTAGATSRFAGFYLYNQFGPSRVNLLSDVYALAVRDSAAGVADGVSSGVRAQLSTAALDLDNTVFSGVPVLVTDDMGTLQMFQVRWENMNPADTYFTFTRADAFSSTMSFIDFAGPAPTTGYYMHFVKTGSIQTSTIIFNNSTPASLLGQRYLKTGDSATMTLIWNGQTLP